MGKKKISVILIAIALVIGSIGTSIIQSNNSKEKNKATYSDNRDDVLVIETSAEINNAEDAVKTAVLLKEEAEHANEEKIESQAIKEIHVVIKGKNTSWLYDGTGSVKEIDLE